MTAPELWPCPFCGGEAYFERIGTRRQSTIYCCNMCGCRLETGEERDHGRDWNTRATSDAMSPEVAALVEAVAKGPQWGHSVVDWVNAMMARAAALREIGDQKGAADDRA